MSGICGYFGPGDPNVLDLMLAAISYRGDKTHTAYSDNVGLGYRWWSGRPGKAPGVLCDRPHLIACAGTLAPPAVNPAAALLERLQSSPQQLDDLDGAFACAWWDGKRMTLLRDPFGVRSLYHVQHQGVFYFASELKQLLAIPGLPVAVDLLAVHKYLTFSFVPGEDVPVRGVRRLLPGRVATWDGRQLDVRPYFVLDEQLNPEFNEPIKALKFIRQHCRDAVTRRLNGEKEVGLYLSGGVDSSGVAWWLKQAGVKMQAFSLDFGEHSVELDQAQAVAKQLDIPLTHVKVRGEDVAPVLVDLVWKLDLPFGDPVTGPQYLLGQAARARGLSAVFNGEGGDQLFGGWTSKPMISAQLYANLYEDDNREDLYLHSYHRFFGLEPQLYTPRFLAELGPLSGQRRRQLLQPFLHSEHAATFLNRVRLADINLKGSQNILPRMERLANAFALDARVPLFDRALAEASFRLPPQLKLHGACEKYVLKLILQKHLPRELVWRRKFGMNVPITDWALGGLARTIEDLLGPAALAKRGLFRPEYVEQLRRGEAEANETRRRRVGERLWTLAMLEAWLRVFIDGRGKAPGK